MHPTTTSAMMAHTTRPEMTMSVMLRAREEGEGERVSSVDRLGRRERAARTVSAASEGPPSGRRSPSCEAEKQRAGQPRARRQAHQQGGGGGDAPAQVEHLVLSPALPLLQHIRVRWRSRRPCPGAIQPAAALLRARRRAARPAAAAPERDAAPCGRRVARRARCGPLRDRGRRAQRVVALRASERRARRQLLLHQGSEAGTR